MLRKKIFSGSDPLFRMRGEKIHRIENFSDAVFAFSISLLIMSLEVPQTFKELQTILQGFLPFLATVSLVVIFWSEHNRYFRHYGFNDLWIVWLNALLLVVILFYVYPLKFLFSLLLSMVTHVNYFPKAGNAIILQLEEFPKLVMIYSIGYAVIWFLFFLMYETGWQRRREIKLNFYELADTKKELRGSFFNFCVGIASFVFAAFGNPMAGGICFLLIPAGLWFVGWLKRRELKSYRAKVLTFQDIQG